MIIGKLLVHITFWYVEGKLRYLKQVVDNFKTYKFEGIDIVIDSNCEEGKKRVLELCPDVSVRIHNVPAGQGNSLVWKHRGNMKNNINNYDFFMYTEDDILVPWEAIKRWHEDTLIIYPGHVRGFLRVEKDDKGILKATDFTQRMKKVIKEIDGHKYFSPSKPYHAFWIYTKRQMHSFIKKPAWINGNCTWREKPRAAAGMMWETPEKHIALVPLSETEGILEETFAYHLPNNYALGNSIFGRIPVSEIFK